MFKHMKRIDFGTTQAALFPWCCTTHCSPRHRLYGCVVIGLPFVFSVLERYFRVLTASHASQLLTFWLLLSDVKTSATLLSSQSSLHTLWIALVLNVLNQFVIGPRVTMLMYARHPSLRELEAAEIAKDTDRIAAIKSDPVTKSINKRFGMAHGISSLANLFQFIRMSFACAPLRLSVTLCSFLHVQ